MHIILNHSASLSTSSTKNLAVPWSVSTRAQILRLWLRMTIRLTLEQDWMDAFGKA